MQYKTYNEMLEEHNKIYNLYTPTNKNFDEAKELYKTIIETPNTLKCEELMKYMQEQIFTNYDTGKHFSCCANDIHKTKLFYSEDNFIIIYGEDTDKNITENCNNDLMKSINGTEITQGMLRRTNDEIWANGLIGYNTHSIIMRGDDTNYGQPGFMYQLHFSSRLEIEILNRYIIPFLISNINDRKYDTYSKSLDIQNDILKNYNDIYDKKMNILLKNDYNTSYDSLFFDALPKVQLNNYSDPKDKQICDLYNKISSLERKVLMLLSKFDSLEETIMDLSITSTKTYIPIQ